MAQPGRGLQTGEVPLWSPQTHMEAAYRGTEVWRENRNIESLLSKLPGSQEPALIICLFPSCCWRQVQGLYRMRFHLWRVTGSSESIGVVSQSSQNPSYPCHAPRHQEPTTRAYRAVQTSPLFLSLLFFFRATLKVSGSRSQPEQRRI